MITLLDPLGDRTPPGLGGPLGFWGSPTNGGGTQIAPLARTAVQNQPVNVAGYPSDKPAGTMWRAFGRVTSTNPNAGSELVYYNLDTCRGHSGSPVWLRTGDTRNLVAIHTGTCIPGPDCSFTPGTVCVPGNLQPSSNRGIFITSSVVAELSRWMGLAPSGLPAPGARPILRFGSRPRRPGAPGSSQPVAGPHARDGDGSPGDGRHLRRQDAGRGPSLPALARTAGRWRRWPTDLGGALFTV